MDTATPRRHLRVHTPFRAYESELLPPPGQS